MKLRCRNTSLKGAESEGGREGEGEEEGVGAREREGEDKSYEKGRE